MINKIIFVIVLVFIFGCSTKQSPTTSEDDNNTILSGDISTPLDSYIIENTFGVFRTIMGDKYHAAEDAKAWGDREVYAMMDGIISFSGSMDGYGWLIIIDHPDLDIYSLYGHLSTRRNKLPEGTIVKPGDLIAYIADDYEDGSWDLITNPNSNYPYWEPHLHFGIREGLMSEYDWTGDDRWMAGWTKTYPTELGWIKQSDFMTQYQNTNM